MYLFCPGAHCVKYFHIMMVLFVLTCTATNLNSFTSEDPLIESRITETTLAALSARNFNSSVTTLPWKRAYLAAKQGDYDAAYPFTRTPEREVDFLFSDPIFVASKYVFSRATDRVNPLDIINRAPLRLCHPAGWELPSSVELLLDTGGLVRSSPRNFEACARLLLLNRDDIFITSSELGMRALHATGAPLTQFHISHKEFIRTPLHLIVSKQHPRAQHLIEKFNQGLAEINNDSMLSSTQE